MELNELILDLIDYGYTITIVPYREGSRVIEACVEMENQFPGCRPLSSGKSILEAVTNAAAYAGYSTAT